MAAGLPTEGTNSQHPRAGDASRKDVPICALTDRVADARALARTAGLDAVVCVNADGVVLGLLRAKELAKGPDLLIQDVMRPGPSTFRPYVPIKEMADFMFEHELESCPVTTSDGRLVGLLLRTDVLRLAGLKPEGQRSVSRKTM